MIPSVDNVLFWYLAASAATYDKGMAWYDAAHNFAEQLDPTNISRAAGVIAALSPMNVWSNNKRKAELLYSLNGEIEIAPNGSNGIGLSNNVRKAIAIFTGADPLDILKGNKVRAFYSTILDPTGDVIPVIDRHAFDIAVGKRTDDKARQTLERKGEYERFAMVYQDAARLAGIGSPQIQAITWEAWREKHGIFW